MTPFRLSITLAALTCAIAAKAPAFDFHRSLVPATSGANVIRPDAEILAHTKPWYPPAADNPRGRGLDDLRFFDASHREVPYVLLVPQVNQRWHDGRILPTVATKKESGFELDLGAIIHSDRLRIEGLGRSFLKRYRLEGSGDRAHWTLLIAEGTLFDLPDQDLTDKEARFLPGDYRYFRVTWDDRSSARVPSPRSVSAREAGPAASPPTLVPATVEHIDSEPRRSRYIVHLPGGNLPGTALVLESSAPDVLRPATIYETRLEGSQMSPIRLGGATLRKASRGDLSASSLRIPIERPEGSDLELEIDDGDNPPLPIATVALELLPLPVIYFETASTDPLDVQYGDPSLERPHYDLEANLQYLASAAGVPARWGAVARSSTADETRVLRFPGGAVSATDYRFSRPLASSPSGLVTLPLDADVLARTRSGLPDLRVADAQNRQVPYLLEKRAAPFAIDLPSPSHLTSAEKNVSRYKVHLPYPTLRGITIVIDTDSAIFDRTVTVEKENEERRESSPLLTTVHWTHTDSHVRPPALQIPLDDPRTGDLVLTIDEGDNAPIHLVRARLLLPSWRVRFFHPGGPLRLLYGSNDAASPRYDLALLAPRIIGKPAREITFEKAIPPTAADAHMDRRMMLFWGAIVLAVLVLLLLLAKLLKEGGITSSQEP